MAQSGYTPILIYGSGTTTNVPLAANLTSTANGAELAINYADGKLFYKDSSSVVQVIASKNAQAGIFTGTGAITIPVGTTAQQPTGVQGMLRYNTTSASFEGYNGTVWGAIGGGGSAGSVISRTDFTATAGQTTFTISYAVGTIDVYRNGIKLGNADYTATSGTSVVLATGAVVGDLIECVVFSTVSVANVVTSISFGSTGLTPSTATQGVVTVAGTLGIANGGTNSTATATAGGVGYGTGTAHAYTTAGTSGQILTSAGAGTPAWITLVPIANGGTNSSATPTSGGVGYGTGTAHAYTAAGTAGQILISAAASAPVWTTTLPIANGGTNGSATPTLGGVIVGTGTAYASTAAGTSGQVLTSNGAAAPTWQAASGGAVVGSSGQAFTTAGTGQTFTIPTGITKLKVTVIGGGGAGGGVTSAGSCNTVSYGIGAAGGISVVYLTGLTPANTILVAVGAGGTGTAGAGNAGGSSSISSGTQAITTCTATGGSGNVGNGNPTGGTGSGGTINGRGEIGGGNVGGGNTMFASSAQITTAAAPATGLTGLYGSGGSGGVTNSSGQACTGGAGGAGIVLFEW